MSAFVLWDLIMVIIFERYDTLIIQTKIPTFSLPQK